MTEFEIDQAGFFEGIGGFSLAAKQVGWECGMWCEINPFCQQILKYYHPKATGYSDIKTMNFEPYHNRIRVLTGGFPCQPYSQAGKRLGKEDERHLWPYMLNGVRAIKPGWVVAENVRGLVNWNGGLVFHEVCTDLEAAGYQVQPFLLPAVAVNAPHRRDRIWFIAIRNDLAERARKNGGTITNANGNGFNWGNSKYEINTGGGWQHAQCNHIPFCSNAANSYSIGRIQSIGGYESEQSYTDGAAERIAANPNNPGSQGGQFNEAPELGQERQQPSGPATKLDKIKDWAEFPTEPPICGGNDGLPTKLSGITVPNWRRKSIEAYGNAVVPALVVQFYKAIQEFEKLYL